MLLASPTRLELLSEVALHQLAASRDVGRLGHGRFRGRRLWGASALRRQLGFRGRSLGFASALRGRLLLGGSSALLGRRFGRLLPRALRLRLYDVGRRRRSGHLINRARRIRSSRRLRRWRRCRWRCRWSCSWSWLRRFWRWRRFTLIGRQQLNWHQSKINWKERPASPRNCTGCPFTSVNLKSSVRNEASPKSR